MADVEIYLRTQITFAQLSKALTSLGFSLKQTPTYETFRNPVHKALIVLPKMAPRERVSEPHLIVIHNTIVGKGIASGTELSERLFQFKRLPTEHKKIEERNSSGATIPDIEQHRETDRVQSANVT